MVPAGEPEIGVLEVCAIAVAGVVAGAGELTCLVDLAGLVEDTCDLPLLFFFPIMVLQESQEETRIPPMAFISSGYFGGKIGT